MGKIGEEITQKIKSAVKAKLIELGIEVDNELPDYIMVLVANKKTQPQMESDLQLFLGSNTVLFTTWLLNVLKKLEEVTVSKKNYNRIEVTNHAGSSGVVITKKEEDMDKRRALKHRIKIEPGTASNDAETEGEDCLDIRANEDTSFEEDANNDTESQNQESVSFDNDEEGDEEETDSRNEERTKDDHDSSEHELETENVSSDALDDDTNHNILSSQEQGDKTDDCESPVPSQLGKGIGLNQDNRIANREKDKSEQIRSKIVFSEISEQIDEVMEKTINGNRRPRDSRDDYSNDRDRPLRERSHDNSSRSVVEQRRSLDNDSPQDRRRISDDRTRRSPYDDRFRDSRRRSPDMRKRYDRRSPEDRHSPTDRRRISDYPSRRSPDDRRRFPLDRRRSPDDRRRSPGRRRSPDDRNRSPDDRRRSPERRFYDDRKRDTRRSPDDRGRLRVMDAREILKRKSRNDESLSSEQISKEDSRGNEKRRKVVSSLVHKPDVSKEKSPEPQIPSLVRVTPRPVRKDAIQPNKKLLLLAVADAEKSVSRRPTSYSSSSRKRELSKSRESRETKASKVEEKRRSSSPSGKKYVPPEKIFITLTNQKYPNDDKGIYNTASREVSARKVYDETELGGLEDELMYEESYFDYDQDDNEVDPVYDKEKIPEYVPMKINEKSVQSKPHIDAKSKCIISLESSPERSCDEWDELLKSSENLHNTTDKTSDSNSRTLASTEIEERSSMERTDDGFEWNRLGPAPVATVKPLSQSGEGNEKFQCEAMHKALERCRFWPNCLSETCIYYHPSSPCKMFPLCKSGNDCLFIHPDCKFGPACLNLKCAFLHRNLDDRKKVEVVEVADLPGGKPSIPVIKCVYFPNCKNLNCKFWHPVKNCKFGRTCARSDCYFFHPTLVLPPKELLTWTPKI